MKSLALTAAAALVLASGGLAQYRPGYPGGYQPPPTVSPYLGLRAGGNPAINYYSIVRPQIEFRGALYGLQQQQSLDAAGNVDPTQPLAPGPTGHPAYFDNLSHFYFNNPASGQAGHGGVGAAGGAGRAQNPAAGVSPTAGYGSGIGLPSAVPQVPGYGGGYGTRRY